MLSEKKIDMEVKHKNYIEIKTTTNYKQKLRCKKTKIIQFNCKNRRKMRKPNTQ